MRCTSSDLNRAGGGGFVPCLDIAVYRVWCPTWITAHEGPRDLCERHARVFMPEYNKHSSDGSFFWGDKADEAFRSVECIFNDDVFLERFQKHTETNLIGRNNSGTFVEMNGIVVMRTKTIGLPNSKVLVVLGDYETAVKRFPKLFEGITQTPA